MPPMPLQLAAGTGVTHYFTLPNFASINTSTTLLVADIQDMQTHPPQQSTWFRHTTNAIRVR